MRTYLENIHQKSHSHKKRFAFLVSGGFTLVVFAVWALVNFGLDDKPMGQANSKVNETNPISSLIGGVGATFRVMWGDFGEIKQGLETVDLEAENSGTSDIYGR